MILALFKLACGDFPCYGLEWVAELLDEEDLVVLGYGDNAYSAVVVENIADCGLAVFKLRGVVSYSEDRSFVFKVACECFFL